MYLFTLNLKYNVHKYATLYSITTPWIHTKMRIWELYNFILCREHEDAMYFLLSWYRWSHNSHNFEIPKIPNSSWGYEIPKLKMICISKTFWIEIENMYFQLNPTKNQAYACLYVISQVYAQENRTVSIITSIALVTSERARERVLRRAQANQSIVWVRSSNWNDMAERPRPPNFYELYSKPYPTPTLFPFNISIRLHLWMHPHNFKTTNANMKFIYLISKRN